MHTPAENGTLQIPMTLFKVLIGWSAVFLFRLIPFRPPNFEPMLAVAMPFSKKLGPISSFAFAFLGIVLFDAVTSGWGVWTWVSALAYGLLSLASHFYFSHRDATVKNFVMFGVVGTIVYDVATGLTVGPLVFGQTLTVALMGQIPFTAMHLLGTVVFAVTLSPALYAWVVRDESLVLREVRVQKNA
ncbi:hypothetical protein EBR66_04360 [bacterium]|nr:hypothetical protein [bacterium]